MKESIPVVERYLRMDWPRSSPNVAQQSIEMNSVMVSPSIYKKFCASKAQWSRSRRQILRSKNRHLRVYTFIEDSLARIKVAFTWIRTSKCPKPSVRETFRLKLRAHREQTSQTTSGHPAISRAQQIKFTLWLKKKANHSRGIGVLTIYAYNLKNTVSTKNKPCQNT